ncbi:MAG: spore coat protein YlbD [Bacilli bacterium]|jgi:hypothetical protein|nr:hypothetical protein [Acholeplasmataceae bacterium]
MASRMDAFRDFVSRYPKLRDDVVSGKRTWQSIYEDWVIMGESSDIWRNYEGSSSNKSGGEDLISVEGIKKILGYIKKVNPDSISKTLNTVQKILQVTQGFSGYKTNKYNNFNSGYNSWWD